MQLAACTGAALCLPLFTAMADDGALSAYREREIEIRSANAVGEWPFSVESGTLTCVEANGSKVVVFFEPWREDVPQEFGNMTLPRSVIVSTNPLALLASIEDRALYRPFDRLETLMRRLAPYEKMGRGLCDAGASGGRDI